MSGLPRKATGDPVLGGWLREYRQAYGLTLKEVGSAVGVSAQSVHAYEAGTRGVPQEVLVQLSVLYGTSLDLLCAHTKKKHRKRLEPVLRRLRLRDRRGRAA